MKPARRHVLLAAAFLVIVGLAATMIPLMLSLTSDQPNEIPSDSDLVVDRKYTVIENALACVDRLDYEQLHAFAQSGQADRLALATETQINQFRCVNLIKGTNTVLDQLSGRDACLRTGAGRGCVWTDVSAINRGR
jgi:hypothetical protein